MSNLAVQNVFPFYQEVKEKDEKKKRLGIFNILKSLDSLPRVTVEKQDEELKVFSIRHEQIYVPDFTFEWYGIKGHYRVYICVAARNKEKMKSGYCICVIPSSLAAAGFSFLYQFIYKNRANNKEAA